MACGILWFSISKSLWSTPELLPFHMTWTERPWGEEEGESWEIWIWVSLCTSGSAPVEVGQVIRVHTWHLQKDRQNLVQFCWGSDPTIEAPHHLIVKSWLNSSPDNNIPLAYIPLSNFIGNFFLHLTYFVWCLHVFFITCTLNMNVCLWCIFHRQTHGYQEISAI